jgi:hypothetical protein
MTLISMRTTDQDTASADRGDKVFIWGVTLVVVGYCLLPLGWYLTNHPRLLDEWFAWALRAAVLAHVVGAALVLCGRRSLWIRVPLASVSLAGALLWFFSAFVMI